MRKYQVIYADPPFQYRDRCHAGERGADYHYQTMGLDSLKQLPVGLLADEDCFLFIWVPFPQMQEGLDLIKAWGFSYASLAFAWVKTNTVATTTLFWGMGAIGTRSNMEVCLLGTKGKPKRVDAGVHSILMRPRLEHSQKPPEVRDLIVKLCGDVPRIELFSRDRVPGWDAHGFEVPGGADVILGAKQEAFSVSEPDEQTHRMLLELYTDSDLAISEIEAEEVTLG
jgi:N6-adenosine-specific RNA methylase IME4